MSQGGSNDRERRIAELMEENRGKSALEASRGYCAALVDGLMAVELASKRTPA
jgi:hypothetical protein